MISMIKDIQPQYSHKDVEHKVNALWVETDAYKRTRDLRKDGVKFFFVDGPPYTTGHIHLGTAWNKIIKDSILRYKSMNGHAILDRAGWDMHGLPIEVKVEESLGFKSKKDILNYGIDNFVSKCKDFALTHKDDMTHQFKELGVWLNWDDPYMTLKDEYLEAAWWTLKQAHEKDLLERGVRVVNWCPRCETAIADSEVEYADRTDPSIYVKFKLKDEVAEGGKDTYIVIWTTTPWTIPANLAVAAHPDFEYSLVEAVRDGVTERLIVATELVESVLRLGRYQDYTVLKTMGGRELEGMRYIHPLSDISDYLADFDHKVLLADYVTVENTGMVHIAPGHGLEDFIVGMENGLPAYCPVGGDGKYTEGPYKGVFVKDADETVIADLDARGALLRQKHITHRYGHCWRCKTPIIYLATRQWFIKISDLKEDMLSEIKKVNWYPEWAGSARFKDWIAQARDWCISRQRYWGIPIPVWECEACGDIEVIGTVDELKAKGVGDLPDLHRPWVDSITFKCKCGGEMSRVEDVFDVWFDSAVASWATLKFPQDEAQFNEWWPAAFITEGHDQTRGWFYSQLGASMVAFGKAPYQSVLMHGFTLDEKGRKMSKSIGNVVAPGDVIETFGADALRMFVLSSSAPWDDLKFSTTEMGTIHRSLNILWNVYRFPLPYMELDKFDPTARSIDSLPLRVEDKWILSRAYSLASDVKKAMEGYELHKVGRAIIHFVLEDLSRWYIQLVRPRTWVESDDPDKLAAYHTLYEVFVTLAKVMAPFMPYMAEDMYQNLVKGVNPEAPDSIHMCDYPEGSGSVWVDTGLEEQMELIRRIVEASANARQKVKRKLRWPVSRIVIAPAAVEDDTNSAAKAGQISDAVVSLEGILKDQTNAKNIIVLEAGMPWDELGVTLTPNGAAIGPAFKKDAGAVTKALMAADATAVYRGILDAGTFALDTGTDTGIVQVTGDMVQFNEVVPEGCGSSEFNGGVVYVDATLSRAIESEGYAREFIRRIQDMRKELDLDVEDSIEAIVQLEDDHIIDLVLDYEVTIASEVRSGLLVIGLDVEPKGTLVKEWDIEGVKVNIGISKMEKK